MIISSIQTDSKLELHGVWKPFGHDGKVLVARHGNPKFNDELRREMEPFRDELSRSTISDDQAETIMSRVMSKTILLGWENIQNEDKSQIKYSQENAFELLEAYPEFRNIIYNISVNVANYKSAKAKEVKEQLGKQFLGLNETANK